MSLIPCTGACIYQKDGLCTLDYAGAKGLPFNGCVHFIPKDAAQPALSSDCAGTPLALLQYFEQEESEDL